MKILNIESDFISRTYLRELFLMHGYEPLSARNAADGLSIFLSEKPDLVVCSLMLPGMSGLEFLNYVRTAGYDTPVIIAAARSSEKIAIQSFRFGATDFIKKPIQDCHIIPILQSLNKKAPKETQESIGDITEGKMVYSFATCIDSQSKIVQKLISQINPDFFDENTIIDIELGLMELITNAIEHGNLNISFEEKTQAIEENTLQQLMESRITDSRYRQRRITVTYEFNSQECRWTIADDGDGFDISLVPDPIKSENIESLHGRGIYMSRYFFDSIKYLGKGNECIATKKRRFLI